MRLTDWQTERRTDRQTDRQTAFVARARCIPLYLPIYSKSQMNRLRNIQNSLSRAVEKSLNLPKSLYFSNLYTD